MSANFFPSKILRALWLLCSLVAAGHAVATTVNPPTFTQLVRGSDYVIRARVTAVESELRRREGRWLVYSKITLAIREVIAGVPPLQPVLEMLGGKVGDEELVVDGAPSFAVGDEDILFVQGNGANFHPLYALGYGRYPIRRAPDGREFVTRADGAPLLAATDVSRPLVEGHAAAPPRVDDCLALTPAAFAAAVHQTRSPARHEN